MPHTDFVVLIPAYKPGPDLSGLVADLVRLGVAHICVVDDGSGPFFRARFDEVAAYPEVRVARHAINLGKGAALKTGINAILCEFPNVQAVVTADADGQHAPEDIIAVAQKAVANPNALVLGSRVFAKDVPLRSKFGNNVTSFVLRIVAGQKLSDTQTGLRAIPAHLLPDLLKIPSQGYEFELDMLLLSRTQRLRILEQPIRTIYLDGNSSSHFNPLLDSMRIYFVLLRFAMISMCTAILDNLLFSAVYAYTGSKGMSQICGRVGAMAFNFSTVKRVVFNTRGRILREFLQYTTLVAVSGAISYGMILLFTSHFGMGVLKSKLLAEGILFLANFLVQRDIIFTGGKSPQTPDQTSTPTPAPAAAAESHLPR
ncbi:MAG TPA: bifunctional glycosyltransferase family 2/GtrA family protein [Bryobacteraceae bacterium]|jgi:putative flippase GtrA|nr:bifunctional glycosyltransferase family 2/GtrA family protein [Bryobacteraceae bacterium]